MSSAGKRVADVPFEWVQSSKGKTGLDSEDGRAEQGASASGSKESEARC